MSLLPIDPEELLVRLSQGEQLGDEEVQNLVRSLRSVVQTEGGRSLSLDDVYSMVVVLQRAQLLEHRHVLEELLELRDSLTVALVLETLCVNWGLTDEYLERVVSFALGHSWDEDEDVKQTSLKILGEYLYDAWKDEREGLRPTQVLPRQQHVVALLLSTFEDEEAETWSRQTAYFSLCRASGKEWEELPSESVELSLAEDGGQVDPEVLAAMRAVPLQSSSSEDPSPSPSSTSRKSSSSGSTTGIR